jgi:FAD/FMN-containing dehydrogenase
MPNWIERLSLSRRQALGVIGSAAASVVAGCSVPGLGRKRVTRSGAVGWGELSDRIEGAVIVRDTSVYETMRRAMVHQNGIKPERYPAAIVRPASERDVQKAVRFAQARGLRVSVRGGGHNWCGSSLRQGGILLDLSALDGMEIDAANQTVSAQPVVTGSVLARRLGEQGLAFPTGHCSTVPISGYLLGGGFGWNAGEWGVACWNILGADVVLADGRLVHASASEHADLFWALRGGGMGFPGVVTRYTLKAYPLPQQIQSSALVFPLEKAGDVAAWCADLAPRLPRNVECAMLFVPAPPPLADRVQRVSMVLAAVFAHTHEEATSALAPFAACPVDGCLLQELEVPETIDSLYAKHDAMYPRGLRYAVESSWLQADPAGVMDRVAGRLAVAPSPYSWCMALIMPPPPADAPPMPDTAFSMVGPMYVGSHAIWEDTDGDAANLQWHRATCEALADATIGFYHNETDMMAEPDRARRLYAPANFERMAAIKTKYDPEGIFFSYLSPADDQA